MSLLNTDRWERRYNSREMDDISVRTYNVIFSLTTTYGLLVFGILANIFLHEHIGTWEYLGVFLIAMLGAFVSSLELPLNFVGYSVMAGALGYICGPFIGQYKMVSITDIAFATVLITLVLGAAGWIYPKSLAQWWSLLMIGLTGLIVAQIALPLLFWMMGLPLHSLHSWLDWCGVILFSGWIVFDFNRAQYLPKTTENAIAAGINVFLDIVNLFIRLLELFGVKTGSDD